MEWQVNVACSFWATQTPQKASSAVLCQHCNDGIWWSSALPFRRRNRSYDLFVPVRSQRPTSNVGSFARHIYFRLTGHVAAGIG